MDFQRFECPWTSVQSKKAAHKSSRHLSRCIQLLCTTAFQSLYLYVRVTSYRCEDLSRRKRRPLHQPVGSLNSEQNAIMTFTAEEERTSRML